MASTMGMAASAIVLAATFAGIFTERLHGFDRVKFAMAGAVTMVIVGQLFGYYDTKLAVEAVDWNVVLLLLAMMTIVAIMLPTGGFQRIAAWINSVSKGSQLALMVLFGTAVTVISLLLDNVTTVVVFGPLVILTARSMGGNPIPILLTIALLSDTGGVATLVGDPPNIMIGSAADIDFRTFVSRMGALVLVAWFATLGAMWFVFRGVLHNSGTVEPPAADSYPPLLDALTWRICVGVLGVTVVLFMLHDQLGWEPWFVAMISLALILVLARHIEPSSAFEQIELGLLIFFLSLFIVVGGVEHSGLLTWFGEHLVPLVQGDLRIACIALMWVAAFVSAAIDNIPFTVAMIPVIQGIEASGINVTPLWWALAVGVGMGGNGTHIGSTANVYIVTISERLAREENDPSLAITPGLWFRKGTPAMLATLVTSSIIMWFLFDFYARPLH